MKIEKVDIMLLECVSRTRPIGIRIYTDLGIYGDGEAALGYGRAACAVIGQLQELAELIVGMDPRENEVIWDFLYKNTIWAQNGGPAMFAAMSAIDIALWDIKGKYYKVPIYELLGGKKRDSFRAYASQTHFGWDKRKKESFRFLDTPEEYAAAALKATEEGYTAIKTGGTTLDRGYSIPSQKWLSLLESRIAAIRDAICDDVDIIIENGADTPAVTTVMYGRRLAPYNIFYFEEPCTPDPKAMKYVSESLPFPIASGERIYTRWQYKPYFEAMSLQVIQPDIGNCGGFTETKKVCDMAYSYDVLVQLHNCHTPLLTAATLHLEAVLPDFLIHEDNDHGTFAPESFERYCTVSCEPSRGFFHLPEGVGLGTEWTDDTLRTADTITVTKKSSSAYFD